MIRRPSRTLFVIGAALLTAACATGQDWSEWSTHSAHFASGSHAFFSLRNQSGSGSQVTRADLAGARGEGWWGLPVMVSSEQILER